VARQNEESKVSTELTVIERAAKALGSADHEPALVELAKQAADITTIKNADGRAQVHGAYMTLKTRRTDIRKAGKDARDDATKFSKAVIAEEDRLVAIIEPEEQRLQKLRDKAEEAAAAANVQAEADAIFDAEQARLKEIDDIWSRPEPAVIAVSHDAMERPKFCQDDCECSRSFVAPVCSYATPADVLENKIDDAKESLGNLDRTYYAEMARPGHQHGYVCGNISTLDLVQVIEAFRALARQTEAQKVAA
jgi:hypothetical protein